MYEKPRVSDTEPMLSYSRTQLSADLHKICTGRTTHCPKQKAAETGSQLGGTPDRKAKSRVNSWKIVYIVSSGHTCQVHRGDRIWKGFLPLRISPIKYQKTISWFPKSLKKEKTLQRSETKPTIFWPYHPTVMLLSISPNELRTYVHKEFDSSFSHNCQNLSIAEMLFSRWRDQSAVVHPENGALPITKRNELSSHEKTWGRFEWILARERSQLKSLCTSWFQHYDILEKARLCGQDKDLWLWGLEEREGEQVSRDVVYQVTALCTLNVHNVLGP